MQKSRKLSYLEKFMLTVAIVFGVAVAAVALLHGKNIAILSPKGPVAHQERDLIVLAAWLSALVVVPVFAMTAFIAIKYRANSKTAKYSPEWDHNLALETIWWLIPLTIITVLSVITWRSTHQLDPSKSLGAKPMTIQVVAMQWKWLFIYPEQQIATINYLEIPTNTPINFEITADAPMNSFWIPQLSGQMYAMSGMSTQLNVEASQEGSYRGVSANISGEGFAGMKFTVRTINKSDFNSWLNLVKQNNQTLNLNAYNKLTEETLNNPVIYYAQAQSGLYNYIINKFNDPTYSQNINQSSSVHNHGEGI